MRDQALFVPSAPAWVPLLRRVGALRTKRRLRAELRRRGSSHDAATRAAASDPASAEAVERVGEYLALDSLERQLATLHTVALRRRSTRLGLVLPHDPACWLTPGPTGILNIEGVAHVERQLRHARRRRFTWWVLLLLSMGAVGASVAASLGSR